MAKNTAISWATHSFNPWWGCTKVGPGCDGCYAEAWDKRAGGAHWGAGVPRRLVKNWSLPRKCNLEAMSTGVRPWVFCASMADVFDNEVPTEWRNMLWELVRETPLLRWIFVTKRIGNAAKMLPSDWAKNFDHCGLVATIANQAEADRDLPKLLLTPAAWRGVSAEPLLGPINFAWALHQLDWIVVGGESGANARPMHPRWAIDIRDQCERAGVSFHFKQWGEWLPLPMVSFSGAGWQFTRERDGKRYGLVTSGHFEERSPEFSGLPIETQHPWPEDGCHYLAHPTMLRVGKARAGRLLDRDEHNGMPPARG